MNYFFFKKEKFGLLLERVYSIIKSHTFLLLFFFFVLFLIIRNWQVFAITDVYDGSLVKIYLSVHGYTFSTFFAYFNNYVFHPFNQHFIPLWFGLFYIFSFFDSNPVLLGLFAFSLAACLIYLIFRIIYHFSAGKNNGFLYALFISLLFSSSIFFLEILSWRWMLQLMISSVLFCYCIYLLLKKPASIWYLLIYTAALYSSMWTFGTGFIGVWGLVLFLTLRKLVKKLSHRSWTYLILTIITALIGTIAVVLTNKSSLHQLNIFYFLVNLPAASSLTAVNIISLVIGVYRFQSIWGPFLFLSSIFGLTSFVFMVVTYFPKLKKKELEEKDTLIISLIFVYLGIIGLSLFRSMPATGIHPSTNSESYILGNRYLFTFSVPLVLAISLFLSDTLSKLHREQFFVLLLGTIILGFTIAFYYPKTDPFIFNPKRDEFFKAIPPMLKNASESKIILPDIEGDLFFKGFNQPLSEVVNVRKEAKSIPVFFKKPSELKSADCEKIKSNQAVTYWLSLYSDKWCNNF